MFLRPLLTQSLTELPALPLVISVKYSLPFMIGGDKQLLAVAAHGCLEEVESGSENKLYLLPSSHSNEATRLNK